MVKRIPKVQGLDKKDVEGHSALFSETFAQWGVECLVPTGQGSDKNVIPPAIFNAVKDAGAKMVVTELVPTKVYSGVGRNSCITCDQKVVLNPDSRIGDVFVYLSFTGLKKRHISLSEHS